MSPEVPPEAAEAPTLSQVETGRWVSEARQQFRQLEFAMRELSRSLNGMDVERPIFFAEAAVDRLYCLQRILWPRDGASESRGEALRTVAGVSRGNPIELAPLASFVENTDERFADWIRDLPIEGYHEISVMPGSLLGFASSANYLRLLDSDTYHFSVRGVQIDLKKLFDEARRIDSRLKRWSLRSEFGG